MIFTARQLQEKCQKQHVDLSLDLEARSRRNNLVFRGLCDVQNENCTGMIIDFLLEEMQIEITSNDIVRALRVATAL